MSRKPRIDKAVYNIPEIAAQMDINIPKAYELARQPGFPSIRIGRRIVVPKEAFHRWLEQVALDKQSCGIGRSKPIFLASRSPYHGQNGLPPPAPGWPECC